jgi:hypothetical protein
MAMFFLRPGVYSRTIDLAQRPRGVSTTVGALVMKSRKGPTEPFLITGGVTQFNELYGYPDTSWGYGHHSGLTALLNMNAMWVKRVVRKAKYAGAILTNDKDGSQAENTYLLPYSVGKFYKKDQDTTPARYTLVFSAALVASNQVQITASFNGINAVATVTFATSSDDTMQALATALTDAINSTFASSYVADGKALGSVTVIKNSGANNNDRVLLVTAPESVTLTFTSTISGGASQPTIEVHDNSWLLDIYAENPGAWANNIGVKITAVDQGIKQKLTLVFSALPVIGNSFNATLIIKGIKTTVGPVNYVTNGAATITAIKNALKTALGNTGDAVVGAGGLTIDLIAPDDGPDVFTIESVAITGGASQPVITHSETRAGVAKDDTFEIHVYTRDNVLSPVEKHVVSFKDQLDGYGTQQFVEEVINLSGSRSDRIRVKYNVANASAGLAGEILTNGTPIVWFRSGDDGELPTASDIANGWDSFADRSQYPVRILINGGESSVTVHQKMIMLAEARKDCFAILDMPSSSQRIADAVAFRLSNGYDSSYAYIITPDVKIVDPYTNKTIFVPPSGFAASIFAYTDNVSAEWFAPAGLNRALLRNVQGLRQVYTDGDQEQLFPNQINYIINRYGKGYTIWTAETLQRKASPLSNVGVRRMLITIEVLLVDALDYSIHEPNDPQTRFIVKQLANSLLQLIKDGRGLRRFDTICDDSNNKSYHYDQGQLNIDMIMEPVLPVKFIRLSSVITKTGASFSEAAALAAAS